MGTFALTWIRPSVGVRSAPGRSTIPFVSKGTLLMLAGESVTPSETVLSHPMVATPVRASGTRSSLEGNRVPLLAGTVVECGRANRFGPGKVVAQAQAQARALFGACPSGAWMPDPAQVGHGTGSRVAACEKCRRLS